MTAVKVGRLDDAAARERLTGASADLFPRSQLYRGCGLPEQLHLGRVRVQLL